MKSLIGLILLGALFLNVNQTYNSVDTDWTTLVDTESMIDSLAEISSEKYQGRFPGSSGDVLVQNYIANKLNSSGIEPLISNTYFQNFTLKYWSQPRMANVTIGGAQLTYITDYVEATLTGESKITNPTEIVFCGYGVDLPTFNDYKDISVEGKIVLISSGAPDFVPMDYHFTSSKINIAASHGAVGLIIVQHPSVKTPFKKSTATEDGFQRNMSTILANRTSIDNYIDFTTLISDLDSYLSTHQNYNGVKSISTGKVGTMEILIDYKENIPAGNILGQIKGTADSYIIISSHYDHLGITAMDDYYPGADDDGSGVVVTLELARLLSNYYSQNQTKKSIIFAFWSSEELGLIGSNYFINNLPIPAEKIQLVLQMDMVGVGPSNGFLYIDGGLELPINSQNSMKNAGAKSGIADIELTQLQGGSDHWSFFYISRPAVMLFWDAIASHKNYHTTLDTVTDINPDVLKKVSLFILNYLFDYEMDSTSQSISFFYCGTIIALVVTSISIKIKRFSYKK